MPQTVVYPEQLTPWSYPNRLIIGEEKRTHDSMLARVFTVEIDLVESCQSGMILAGKQNHNCQRFRMGSSVRRQSVRALSHESLTMQ
jgi:hypothetical protein